MNQLCVKRAGTQSEIALHLMVNRVVENPWVVTNHISPDIYVDADLPKLAAVMSSLLTAVSGHTKQTGLTISAKKYHNVLLLHLKTETELNFPEFIETISGLQPMAQEMGGTIELTSYRNNISTVAFSFLNRVAAKN